VKIYRIAQSPDAITSKYRYDIFKMFGDTLASICQRANSQLTLLDMNKTISDEEYRKKKHIIVSTAGHGFVEFLNHDRMKKVFERNDEHQYFFKKVLDVVQEEFDRVEESKNNLLFLDPSKPIEVDGAKEQMSIRINFILHKSYDEIAILKSRNENKSLCSLFIGKEVKITGGEFEDVQGTLLSCDEESGVAKIKVIFFGHETEVDVKFERLSFTN